MVYKKKKSIFACEKTAAYGDVSADLGDFQVQKVEDVERDSNENYLHKAIKTRRARPPSYALMRLPRACEYACAPKHSKAFQKHSESTPKAF